MTVASAFGDLAPLRDRPVPDQSDMLKRKAGFREHPIDISADAFDEPLVNLRQTGLQGENFYASARNPPHYEPISGSIADLWVRAGVAARLEEVNHRLAAKGLGLWMFDGWRPNAVQQYFHDIWMPELVRRLSPKLGWDEVTAEVETYWSAPTLEEYRPAPHLTGGAVDLTLCWADTGQQLWMGSLFDDVSDIAHLDYFEKRRFKIALSADEAMANRRLLYWVMVDAGFCANPSEWWHFSYGDQMWARLTAKSAALYGATAPPDVATPMIET